MITRTLTAQAIPCTMYRPARCNGMQAGLVIHLYGHGGSYTNYNLLRPPYARLREALREQGYWLLVPDLGPSHWMNAQAVAALDAVCAEMIAHYAVDPRRMHLLGTSMGGGSALIYGYQRPETVRSICAIFPMTDFPAWVAHAPAWHAHLAHAHGLTAQEAPARLHELSPMQHLETLASIPLLLAHGEADAVVPVTHSRTFTAAVRAAGGQVVYEEVGGYGHDDNIAAGLQDEIMAFLRNGQ